MFSHRQGFRHSDDRHQVNSYGQFYRQATYVEWYIANRYGRLVDKRKQNEEKYRIYVKKEEW